LSHNTNNKHLHQKQNCLYLWLVTTIINFDLGIQFAGNEDAMQ